MKPSTAKPNAKHLIVLGHLDAAIQRDGWAPTMRELARAAGTPYAATIKRLIDGLDRRGLIVRGGRGTARTMRITPAGRRALKAVRS